MGVRALSILQTLCKAYTSAEISKENKGVRCHNQTTLEKFQPSYHCARHAALLGLGRELGLALASQRMADRSLGQQTEEEAITTKELKMKHQL